MSSDSIDDAPELLALEQAVMAAIRTRDIAELERLITDDFVLREPLKPDVDRHAFLHGVLAIPGEIEVVAGDGVRARIEPSGHAGIITGVQRVRVRLGDGTIVEDAGAFADLCVKRDGKWRMSVAFNVGHSWASTTVIRAESTPRSTTANRKSWSTSRRLVR